MQKVFSVLQKIHRRQGQLSRQQRSSAVFLEVEIIDNSFSFPGAKAAFCCCLVCSSEFGVPGAARLESRGLFKHV